MRSIKNSLRGADNPYSDHIEDEEDVTSLNLPPEELLTLLRNADEAAEDIQDILPDSMNEIDLGDSIPSADDMRVIFSVMKRYIQLEQISVRTINPRQLERIVPWADHGNLKVSIRNMSVTPTESEFQKLHRIFTNHKRYLDSLLEDSFISISLMHMDLTVSRFGQDIVPWIARNCQNLDIFALMMPCSYLKDFAIIISGSTVKIKRLTLFEQIKFCREELHVSGAHAICSLMSCVTEKIFLDFKVDDPFLLGIIQQKLNSLPQTNLEIQFEQKAGLYRLRWRKQMICPRTLEFPRKPDKQQPSTSTDR